MKLSLIFTMLFTGAFLQPGVAATPKIDTLAAAQLKPLGRFALNKDLGLEMISSAVHLKVSFSGKTCALYATIPDANGHNYLQYELDGVYQKRLIVSGSSKDPITITANGDGKHILSVYKATEATTGPIFLSKIVARNIKASTVAKRPIIEFIGNSITCGAAADPSETPCRTGVYHDQHNAYMAYGPRLARDLNVEFVLSSVSGIGIYRTWNRNGPSMPQVYEKIDFQDRNDTKWNFETFKPAIISIALGTNDLSNGDGKTPRLAFDSVMFVNNYVEFITSLKLKHPAAKIALLSSPMVKGNQRKLLENLLTAIKQKIDAGYPTDKKVSVFFFEPMVAHGCSGHPDVEDHAILASQLKPFFKEMLRTD